ncbi:MAG: SDR family NAD(P)-dependent oxidoreductase [Candidatus Mcinerneyibacterium aminivorans]|uniref:SDR family NAD(P)-dependent oxidoreductase n=1 Tax=Candidatus Mcinerneyibacterium aminivorans TaxID=2703815 RepID=A0A5D0MI44_9BACT|nr:MAG: SDR family NAD(P)-dependent oxidoreductase [Candidatus Mcinerneyibacterium aminivorans]
MDSKSVVIIGASSGIGKGLAYKFSQNGYRVGLVARRINLLKEIAEDIPTRGYVKQIDVTETQKAMSRMKELLKEMKNVDIVVLNAGAGNINHELDWQKEEISIQTNILGFTSLLNVVYHYFRKQQSGHIVGISSIAALFGNRYSPAYSASKTYISKYLDGIRNKTIHDNLNIEITDIMPGFVDTKMAQGEHVFWKVSVAKAVNQIYKAIIKKKKRVYIPKRWRLIAWLINLLPDFILDRI